MSTGLHVKYPVFFCQILMKPDFSRQIFVNYSILNFMRNPPPTSPVGAELFHAGGAADGREANIRFSQFCEGA